MSRAKELSDAVFAAVAEEAWLHFLTGYCLALNVVPGKAPETDLAQAAFTRAFPEMAEFLSDDRGTP